MKRTLPLLAWALCVCSLSLVAGCNGGANSVVINLSSTSATVQAGGTMQFTATVVNDSANKGVTWSVTCSVTQCGSVSPTTTPSGTPTTYTAPTTPPASDLTVTITVSSVADSTKKSTITVTIPAITVTVAPATANVQSGATAQLTATVAHDPATAGVTWSVTCSVAQCGSVLPTTTPSGTSTTYTAPTAPPASNLTVTITAKSVSDTTKSGSATITVPAITVAVAPATATVQSGATGQFTATVTNDPAAKGVTWSVTCSVAQCGSVAPTTTPSGTPTTYTAPSTPPTSTLTVTIKAISVSDTTKSNSATITVPAITISVAPPTSMALVGTTQNFTATVTNTSNTAVAWKLTQGGAACTPACGTLNNTSANPVTYTPPTAPSNLTITIIATSAADATKSASATITVPAITVSVTPSTANVAVSGFTSFTATVGNDGANKGVTWTLSQGGAACAPAICGTINAGPTASGSGTTYQAPAGMPANPNVTVTATSVTDPTKTASATVIITPVSVSVSPTTASVVVNGTQQFTATVTFDAHNLGVSWTITSGGTPCPLGCGSVSPSSSLSGVAVTYTAPSTVPGGLVTLTATSTTDPTKSASATITVAAAPPISVAITQQPPSSLVVGGTASVTATVTNDPATGGGVDWTVTCGSAGMCGSLNPAHTASGTHTVYTAPASVPSGSTVTITATSTADATKSANANPVTITALVISVSFTMAPPSSLVISSTASITASISNDPAGKGADWTVTCGSVACGSFNPVHTASGAATVYTAPATVPTGNTVTIKATSTADTTKSVSSTVTITASSTSCPLTLGGQESLLSGTYAVLFNGWSDAGNPGQAAASFTADGAGNIPNGVADSSAVGSAPLVNQAMTAGCYSIGSDHRGKMIWNFGSSRTVTFSFVMRADGKNGDLIEFDDTTGTTGGRGSGSIRKQDTTLFVASTLTSAWAFGVRGSKGDGTRAGSLGAFSLDGVSTLSGGAVDYSEPTISFTGLAASGSFTAPDATHGRGTLTIIIASVPGIGNLTLHFAYYITRGGGGTQPLVYLQSTDTPDAVGHALQNGVMIKQATPTGGFGNASLNGTVVFALTGNDTSHGITNTIVGLATSTGNGVFAGFADQEADATPLTNQAVSGTISIGANGMGTVQITAPAPQVPTSIVMVAPNEALMLEGTAGSPGNDVQTGIFQPQTGGGTFSPASLSGSLVFGSDEPATTNVGVNVGAIQITSAGNFTITQDGSGTGGLQPGQVLTGTYTMTANGRGDITITSGGSGTATIYLLGTNKAVVMPRGGGDIALINLEQ